MEANQPQHIAIIMDGNGRWAKMRGLPRIKGHQAGAKVVRTIVEECARRKLKELTLFAFSTDNWKRPKAEVNYLMKLLNRYLIKEEKTIMDNNIKFKVIGRIDELPIDIRNNIARLSKISEKNTGMVLRLAINYSGKVEIIDAIKKLYKNIINNGASIDNIQPESFSKYLYDPDMSEPDLLIRTAGEYRLSNFLLWQISYTELWFTDVYWPDFTIQEIDKAIESYSKRERRFGGILSAKNKFS